MAETLLQKAQRLGIQPVGSTPAVSEFPKESLIEKANRLGIKPANANPEKSNNFIQDVAQNLVARPAIRFGQLIGAGVVKGVEAFQSPEKRKITEEKFQRAIKAPTVTPLLGTTNAQKGFGEGGGKQIATNTGKSALDIATLGTGAPINTAIRYGGKKVLATAAEKVGADVLPNVVKKGLKFIAKKTINAGANVAEGEAYNTASNLLNERKAGENAGDVAVGSVVLPAVLNGTFKGIKNVRNRFKVEHQINKLEDFYVKHTGGTKSGKKLLDKLGVKTEAFNKAGTQGRTAERTLAENGVMPKVAGTKFDTFSQITDLTSRAKPYKQLQQKALKEVEQQTEKIPIDELHSEALAKANTDQNIHGGKAKGLIKKINSAIAELKAKYGTHIPITKLDEFKSARWDNAFGNKALVEGDKLAKDADYLLGNIAKEKIEKVAESTGNPHVAQLNREIGDIYNAAKMLEKLDGQTIKGGRLGKYVGTMIGSSLGSSIPGKIVGAVGGNAVAEFLMRNEASNPLTQFVLRKLEKENPAAFRETEKWLIQQGKERQMRLQLPAGKGNIINEGRPIKVNQTNNADYIGRDLRVETGQNTLKTPKTTQKAMKARSRYVEAVKTANEASKPVIPMADIQMGAKPKPKASNLPTVSHETAPKVIAPASKPVTRYTSKTSTKGGTFESTRKTPKKKTSIKFKNYILK